MARLLHGIRVVELASLLVGDYVGMLLGDEGADVVKIERPGEGDYVRDILAQFAPRWSPAHVIVNRNKRSVALDLTVPEGRHLAERLVATADVFVTGLVGDAPRRLGMDPESLHRIRPDLVYCQVTGFGARGPYSEIPTHGLMMNALGRAPALTTRSDGRVHVVQKVDAGSQGEPGDNQAVVVGPLFAAYSVAAALVRRSLTGQGAFIDVSCADASVAAATHRAVAALNARRVSESERGQQFAWGARFNYYATADQRYILFCCIEFSFWRRFCEVVGRPDLIATHEGGVADFGAGRKDLSKVLVDIFAARSSKDWANVFAQAHLPGAPAVSLGEVPGDPHLAARRIVITEDHPVLGRIAVPASPIDVEGEAFVIEHHASDVGEHTAEVLAELGVSTADMAELQASGVVGVPGQGGAEIGDDHGRREEGIVS